MLLALRAVAVWLLIAAAEVAHGMLRMAFLRPLVGDLTSRQLAIVSGSLIVLAIAWLTRRFLAAITVAQQLAVGAMWATLMVAFDLLLGRLYIGYPWSRLLQDFDPTRGGFMLIGVVLMLLAPWIVARRR
jgi:hypothetical protein